MRSFADGDGQNVKFSYYTGLIFVTPGVMINCIYYSDGLQLLHAVHLASLSFSKTEMLVLLTLIFHKIM